MKTLAVGLSLVLGFGPASVFTVAARAGDPYSGNVRTRIDVTDPAYGAKGDGVTDDTNAIQTALTAAGAPVCGTVVLTCTPANTFLISNTLRVPSCVKFRGECGGGPGITHAPIDLFGSTLKWAGPKHAADCTTTRTPAKGGKPEDQCIPVVWYHDVAHSSQEMMNVDCQNVAGTVGTQYDSDNNPPSSFNDFSHLIWNGCHVGFVNGEAKDYPLTSPPTSPPDCVPPNQPGCYEADQYKLENFIVYGPYKQPAPIDPSAEGILVNSANAAQMSVIRAGNVQILNTGLHVVTSNGNLTVSEFTGGSVANPVSKKEACAPPTDPIPTLLKCDTAVATCPNLINNQSEGKWCFAVHDSSCNTTPGTPVWIGNQWNNDVLVDGCENVVSIGSGTGVGARTAAGSSRIATLNDAWSTSGGGLVVSLFGAAISADKSITTHDQMLAAGDKCPDSPPPAGRGQFPPGATLGDIASCESATIGKLFLGNDGQAFVERDASGNIISQQGFKVFHGAVSPAAAGGQTAGTAALPFSSAYIGSEATKNTQIVGAVTAARTLSLPDGDSSTSLVGSLTTKTSTTSDLVVIAGVTASSHCSLTPTNAAAAADMSTTFVSAKTTNQITVSHAPTINMTFDIQCTAH